MMFLRPPKPPNIFPNSKATTNNASNKSFASEKGMRHLLQKEGAHFSGFWDYELSINFFRSNALFQPQMARELEGTLSRVGTAPETPGQPEASPTTPVRSSISTSHVSTVVSGREGPSHSTSSPFPAASTQTPSGSYDQLARDDPVRASRSACQWGPNWYFNGIPISSEGGREWVSQRTGQAVSWADFSIPIMGYSEASILQQSFSHTLYELPDQHVTREIAAVFFNSSFRLVFPVLDEILFQTTLEAAYEPVEGTLYSSKHISARACVLSMLAVVPRLGLSRQLLPSIDADLCATRAHCLLLCISDDSSLPTLEAAVMLLIQRACCTDWHGATFFQSIACRIVCALRGHLCHTSTLSGIDSEHSEREVHHIRMLFWLCYIIDKDISLFTGNPPLLTGFYCNLTLPNTYYDHYAYLPSMNFSPEGSPQNTSPYLPGDPHLSHLKEKVYRQLLSARTMHDNDNQLLLNIRQLDDEIEHWRLSIPIEFRPALFVSKNSLQNTSNEAIPYMVRRMTLQLDYHHLMTVIHTTVRKCTAKSSDEVPDLHSVVHSSFDLSLVASRSTLWCLKTLVSLIAEDAFRFVTFYSTAAALSLLLNIVIHPLDAQSRIDLELLILAANTIRNMPTQALTKTENSHIRELSKFVMRLVWLGTCAVTKAENEAD
ncbi:uncharacterized protein TRUGW13939_11199 [Talaromyces rugulosus]|uniref:Xylanolytic transcriptional activator regulatory domain-containing protein n=1 Tax=Talaromyces rugulosus TaxID=121627 RepID=A0A7H8RCL6_TALRU|nr:uncharacterized protein TRUGW13939_11199 [Talaromyces rugulosus]QKX64026.1 hypothetical protein TRUGW13939_11199 [Talaromyces rugulosus]